MYSISVPSSFRTHLVILFEKEKRFLLSLSLSIFLSHSLSHSLSLVSLILSYSLTPLLSTTHSFYNTLCVALSLTLFTSLSLLSHPPCESLERQFTLSYSMLKQTAGQINKFVTSCFLHLKFFYCGSSILNKSSANHLRTIQDNIRHHCYKMAICPPTPTPHYQSSIPINQAG